MSCSIVEDDPEAAAYLVKAFREAGHVADHSPDGLEGYAMAREGDYDVLIIDRMLPKLGRTLADPWPAGAEGGYTRPDPFGPGPSRRPGEGTSRRR